MSEMKESTARLEVVTHQQELPQAISQHYGVPVQKVAITQFYTVFALDTYEVGAEDSGADMLVELKVQQEIVAYAWSRPLKIIGCAGRQPLIEHFREIRS